MIAAVDKNLCIGCQLCVTNCPAVFAMNSDNLAKAAISPVPADQEEKCRSAAKECPVNAITIS
jgi:ferredoxin